MKSTERVRDLGEVFTPAATVEAMLDLLPQEVWEPHPAKTFLEPACGDGNFLVAILRRKLEQIARHAESRSLPAGTGPSALMFHAIEALASIYAVDISPDNVIGGTPGHEIGARERLIRCLHSWTEKAGVSDHAFADWISAAKGIVVLNVQVGNMLESLPDGTPTRRDELPIFEYTWSPGKRTVQVVKTTLGAALSEAEADAEGVQSLFSLDRLALWQGPAKALAKADFLSLAMSEWELRPRLDAAP